MALLYSGACFASGLAPDIPTGQISQTLRDPAQSDLRLTLPEHAIGTPAFMAPEVALGQELDAFAGGFRIWEDAKP